MYRIIGADKNEYGPVSAEQLRQWITEGRVNGQTMVRAENTTDWKPLRDFPELSGLTAPPPGTIVPPPTTGATPVPMMGFSTPAADQVSAPATGLIATAIIGFVWQIANMVLRLVWNPQRFNMGSNAPELPQWITAMSGSMAIVGAIIGILAGIVILYGGLQMKKLENYSLAIGASIVAMIPCISPCCLIGLPIGIWALIVLSKPEVKSAFH